MPQTIEIPDDRVARLLAADVAVVAYLELEGDLVPHVLLVNRADHPDDVWFLPGGHQEPADEDNMNAGRRETYEETGLIVERKTLRALCFLDVLPGDSRPGLPRVSVVYLTLVPFDLTANVRPGDKITRVRWTPIDSDQTMGFGHAKAIAALRKEYL